MDGDMEWEVLEMLDREEIESAERTMKALEGAEIIIPPDVAESLRNWTED